MSQFKSDFCPYTFVICLIDRDTKAAEYKLVHTFAKDPDTASRKALSAVGSGLKEVAACFAGLYQNVNHNSKEPGAGQTVKTMRHRQRTDGTVYDHGDSNPSEEEVTEGAVWHVTAYDGEGEIWSDTDTVRHSGSLDIRELFEDYSSSEDIATRNPPLWNKLYQFVNEYLEEHNIEMCGGLPISWWQRIIDPANREEDWYGMVMEINHHIAEDLFNCVDIDVDAGPPDDDTDDEDDDIPLKNLKGKSSEDDIPFIHDGTAGNHEYAG
jgi:hypothetical protein